MDVQLDVSPKVRVSRLDVIEGPSGRKGRSKTERARIAAESFRPDVKVADLARKHGTTRWQIYDWRKQLRHGRLVVPEDVASSPGFAQVVIAASATAPQTSASCIEVVVADIVVRAPADATEDHLVRVLRAAQTAAA